MKTLHGCLIALGAVGFSLALGACGDYAAFKVDIRTSKVGSDPVASLRDYIATCKVTITDGSGATVLDGYRLADEFCSGSHTNADVGNFSWTTTDVNGKFVFRVDGLNSNSDVIQSGQSNDGKPEPAKVWPPEIQLQVITK